MLYNKYYVKLYVNPQKSTNKFINIKHVNCLFKLQRKQNIRQKRKIIIHKHTEVEKLDTEQLIFEEIRKEITFETNENEKQHINPCGV